MQIPERFKTVSDRIKEYLISMPEVSFNEAYEHFIQTKGMIIKKGLFYKIRHELKYNLIDHKTSDDCYRDLVKLAHEGGFDILKVIRDLNTYYTSSTILEQIRVILNIAQYPEV